MIRAPPLLLLPRRHARIGRLSSVPHTNARLQDVAIFRLSDMAVADEALRDPRIRRALPCNHPDAE